MTKWSFFSLALLTGVGCAVVACSSDGDDSMAAGGSGGVGGKGAAGGSSAGKGGGNSAGTGATTEGGAGGDSGTIYDRLGGKDGITTAVDAIVAAEVQDADIASYFSQQADAAHTPTVADIKACLVLQLGSVTGGPEKYPAKLTNGYQCRDMATTHAELGINSGTFDAFVTIAAGVLAAKPFSVSAADLGAIGSVLVSTKAAIVTDVDTLDEKPCTAPAACAVAAAGAGGAG